MRIFSYGLLSALTLYGCAVTDDPTRGGLFGGIYGVESGAYDQRLGDRQATLDSVKIQRQSAEEQQRRLAGERTAKQQEKSQLNAQVAKLGQDTKKLKNELAKLKVSGDKAKQEKAALGKRLDQVNAELKTLPSSGASDDASRQRAEQLEKEVKQLWEIYHSLQ